MKTRKLTRIEHLIIKLTVIQFVFLIIAQWLVQQNDWAVHLNKTFYYEGVVQDIQTKIVETLDQ
jgi:hypothetical protein